MPKFNSLSDNLEVKNGILCNTRFKLKVLHLEYFSYIFYYLRIDFANINVISHHI